MSTELESLSQKVGEHGEWMAAHEAEESVRWESQKLVNKELKESNIRIWDKLDTIQVKLGVITGGAAIIGGLLGTLIAKVF